MANNRIEYIDTAKGLCMLLIVASHVGISDPWPGAYSVRVILFFVLSGFFFSAKQTPKDFLQKKVRTILWPFVFWWCLSYAIFYAGMRFVPNFSWRCKINCVFLQKKWDQKFTIVNIMVSSMNIMVFMV